jgi:hypothetical protein
MLTAWGNRIMQQLSETDTLANALPDSAVGPSRSALLIALVDRARHDRAFGADLRREPIKTADRMGLHLRDSEWAGLRDLLVD